MKKRYLFGLLLIAVATVGATAMFEAPTPALADASETQFSTMDVEMDWEAAQTSSDSACDSDGSFLIACNCLDQCRFNFQCGPGGSCDPSGPCGCKVCASSE